MRERVVAFIVARLSSSRLPKKHLKRIGNKRLLDWTIENLKKSRFLDEIVIATAKEEENRLLGDLAKEHGIDVYWFNGDINDVVGRLNKASQVYKADIPVLISGDCPLIYAPSLDKLIEKAIENKNIDHVGFCLKDNRPPIHEGMGVFRKKCWELADKLSTKPNLREHHFPIVGLRRDIFKIDCVECEDIFYKVDHRISVDTLADLEFMNRIYNELTERNKEFNLKNVVELLIEKPRLMDINRDVHQISVDERPKKALFVVNNNSNIELFYDLAYELTKRGVGVRFFSRDKEALRAIEHKGFGIVKDIENDKVDFRVTDEDCKEIDLPEAEKISS